MADPVTTGAGGARVVIAGETGDLDPSDLIIDTSGEAVAETDSSLITQIPPLLSPRGDGDWTVETPPPLLPRDGPHDSREADALG